VDDAKVPVACFAAKKGGATSAFLARFDRLFSEFTRGPAYKIWHNFSFIL
jgi:hypothetical protein